MSKSVVEAEYTYFYHGEILDIENIEPGEVVYLKVRNPLRYGNREIDYFGKIIKSTRYYFWILEYCDGDCYTKSWKTSEIIRKEAIPEKYTKRWAKKSVVEIKKARTAVKLVSHEVWNSF